MDSMDFDNIRVSVEYPRESRDSKLMEWMHSIDILKHVTERHLGDMFVDGVLFFHLLRELFEEEMEDADGLAREILPSENYLERLLNWRILNDKVLEKLKIERSSWFLEYLAKGNVDYIKNLLDSIREIARPKYVERDIITQLPHQRTSFSSSKTSSWRTVDTDYYNDIIYKAKNASKRSFRTRRPSPFPRSRIANERVIWGGPPRYQQPQQPSYPRQRSSAPSPSQRRKSTQRHADDNYQYYGRTNRFSTRFKPERSFDRFRYDEKQEHETPAAPVETYCFLERRIRKRFNNNWQAMKTRLGVRRRRSRSPFCAMPVKNDVCAGSEDVDTRFRELLDTYEAKPYIYNYDGRRRRGRRGRRYLQFQTYLYKYYRQYDYGLCNFCNVEEQDEDQFNNS